MIYVCIHFLTLINIITSPQAAGNLPLEIEKEPEPELIEMKVNEYVSHLIEKWRLPLSEIPEDKFHSPSYTSNWGVEYCIDAMLEHAVMHPIRHEFQLKNLFENQKNT